MNRKARLLTLLAIAVIAGLIVIYSTRDGAPTGPAAPDAATTETGRTDAGAANAANAEAGAATPTRREVVPAPRDAVAAQGLQGRIVSTAGTPIEGAELLLFESYGQNPLSALIDRKRGTVPPPVARTTSGPDGRFRIGVSRSSPEGYELRADHTEFTSKTTAGITLFAERWIEIGDISLDPGVTLEGWVHVQGGPSLPVANATVTIAPTGVFSGIGAPNRGDGTRTTQTDAGGRYVIEHCPVGLITATAVAPGFARVEREAVELRREVHNRIDFTLPKGAVISGQVVDEDGEPIAGAELQAFPLNTGRPVPIEARSHSDGSFEVIGVMDAPHQLVVSASGFVRRSLRPIPSGALSEPIVLQRQGGIEVRVVAPDGRAIGRFDAEIKAHEPGREKLANVPQARLHRVVPAALENGAYRIEDVDPGSYVVQVEAKGLARTFSEPVTVSAEQPLAEVEVRMLAGGALEGSVQDHTGRPLSGVRIQTLPGDVQEGPMAAIFQAMLAEKQSRAEAHSGVDGFFEIPALAPGVYQIRLSHPDHAGHTVRDIEVSDSQATQVATIRMERGAVVSGTALLDGSPAGQIQVSILSVADPKTPDAQVFRAETTTDDQGRFRFADRLPPGHYQARAARQTLPTPILKVADFAKTKQDFHVVRGQEGHQLHFALTSN